MIQSIIGITVLGFIALAPFAIGILLIWPEAKERN